MDRIDLGSIIILSACGMNETFFLSVKFTLQILKDLLDFSYVERTDFFVERTDYFMERLASEQALCLGKKIARKGKGKGTID